MISYDVVLFAVILLCQVYSSASLRFASKISLDCEAYHHHVKPNDNFFTSHHVKKSAQKCNKDDDVNSDDSQLLFCCGSCQNRYCCDDMHLALDQEWCHVLKNNGILIVVLIFGACALLFIGGPILYFLIDDWRERRRESAVSAVTVIRNSSNKHDDGPSQGVIEVLDLSLEGSFGHEEEDERRGNSSTNDASEEDIYISLNDITEALNKADNSNNASWNYSMNSTSTASNYPMSTRRGSKQPVTASRKVPPALTYSSTVYHI